MLDGVDVADLRGRRSAELRRRRTRYRRCRALLLASVTAGVVLAATALFGSHGSTASKPPQRAAVPSDAAVPAAFLHREPAAKPPGACAGNPAGVKLLSVSISQQHMWACEGDEIASTSAVTTGAYALAGVDSATPTGTWHVTGKTTDVYLNGCDALGCWHDYVHYWVPFDGAVGFHDASWQTFPYGSSAYATQGSHGCVHLPEAEMAWVYDWASEGTTVIVTA